MSGDAEVARSAALVPDQGVLDETDGFVSDRVLEKVSGETRVGVLSVEPRERQPFGIIQPGGVEVGVKRRGESGGVLVGGADQNHASYGVTAGIEPGDEPAKRVSDQDDGAIRCKLG